MRVLEFRFSKLVGGLLLCILLVIVITCSKPFEPVEPPKDYRAYFWSAISNDSNWYFAYHPTSNEVDSVFLPYASYPVVSADGRKLYIRDDLTSSVAVLDTDTFTVIDNVPYDIVSTVSPDNEFLLAYKSGQGHHLIRTSDYSSIYEDSTIWIGRFSRSGKKLYALSADQVIRRLEISDSVYESGRFNVPFGETRDFEFSLDETKIFYYLRTGVLNHHFAVYDVRADSVVYTESVNSGFGELVVSQDDKYVFYSNPGSIIGGASGTPWVSVYDVRSNQLAGRITTAGLIQPPYEGGVPLGPMCCTPDGKWLIALTPPDFRFIFAIHVRPLTIEKYVQFDGAVFLQGLTCPSCP
jgi:DNA-binding beta-propeller fold protein YncE